MLRQFNKGVFLATICIGCILFLLPACEKTSSINEKDNAATIEAYKSTLFKDADFVRNFQADRILSGYLYDPMKKFDEQGYQILVSDVSNAKTDNDLTAAFKKSNVAYAENIVSLFIEKRDALSRVKAKYPKLSDLSRAEFNQLFIESYKSVTINVQALKHAEGCSNNCCDGYVGAMSDCDTDFAIATGWSLLAAGAATIFGTPIAGAVAVSSGIGAAYMASMRCSATAASGYRSCMGY
jgi:hypothetical protein